MPNKINSYNLFFFRVWQCLTNQIWRLKAVDGFTATGNIRHTSDCCTCIFKNGWPEKEKSRVPHGLFDYCMQYRMSYFHLGVQI